MVKSWRSLSIGEASPVGRLVSGMATLCANRFWRPFAALWAERYRSKSPLVRLVLQPHHKPEALLGCQAKLPSGGGLG
jgi:hypothetical protein